MKSLSGSFIQSSQSSPKERLFERCVVVAGDLESNKRACRMILEENAEDTRTLFRENISNSGINYPIPTAFPGGPVVIEFGEIHSTIEARNDSCDASNYIVDETVP